MLIALVLVTIAIVWWAYALARRGRPAWIRWIGIGCAVTTVVTSTISLAALQRAHDAITTEDASNKATALANGISVAMNVVAVGVLCAVVAIVVLVVFTVRKPKLA